MLPITYGTAASRALKLRCPRCGQGPLFRNWFLMHPTCPHCGLRYERAPGYFLGSTYVNYGLVVVSMTAFYMGFHYGADFSNEALAAPLLVYCLIFPLLTFRYARSWWLAMDCYLDPTSFAVSEDFMTPGFMTMHAESGDPDQRPDDEERQP